MLSTTTAAEWAAAYAAGGALVFPLHTPVDGECDCRRRGCEHAGKHPRTLHGHRDAATDPDTVARWWSMWPTANIGVRPAPGHVVLDVDPRNGGDQQLAAMQQRYGQLPTTRTAITGSGGLHLWFRLTGDIVGELAPGIDVKTHAGYLVAPPSVHVCGGTYTWSDTGPIVEAPTYLAALLQRPERPPRALSARATVTPAVIEGLVRTVRTAPTGKRNDLLFWGCLRATQKGINLDPLVTAAIENGLSAREAEATAASAANAATKSGVG